MGPRTGQYRGCKWRLKLQRFANNDPGPVGGLLVQVHAENDDILEGTKRELLARGLSSFAYHAAARPAVARYQFLIH